MTAIGSAEGKIAFFFKSEIIAPFIAIFTEAGGAWYSTKPVQNE